MNRLKYGTPESVGISSEAILHLMERLEEQHICMNSLLIARHGTVVSETYYKPYHKKKLHRMFSVTKSLVSLAIGLLEADGCIELEDSICKYFPEYVPSAVHPWLARTTIQDMLTMRSCHANTTYDVHSEKDNWVESFFVTKPTNPPGTVFQYDTSASHVLCALVEKLTGQDLLDFLKDRFLRELGWSEESYVMKDPFGTSMGGAGLMALPEDLLRLGMFLLDENEQERLNYPKAYLQEALRRQVSVTGWNRTCAGYGYQFWMLPDDGFGMIGRADQDVLCFPKQELIVAYTADTEELENLSGLDVIYDTVRQELLKTLQLEPLLEQPEALHRLQEASAQAEIPKLRDECETNVEAQVSGQWYDMKENAAWYGRMRVVMDATGGVLEYMRTKEPDRIYQIPFGKERFVCGMFPEYDQECAASAAWMEPQVLFLRVWLTDERIGNIQIRLHFGTEGSLTVWMKKWEECSFEQFQGIFTGVRHGREASECCICQG